MSYSSVPEALDYFSYQPLSSQHVVWPTMMCPPWNTMVFPEPDPTLRDSDHFQAPHLFVQTSRRLADAEPEFNQCTIPAIQPTEVDETQQPVCESPPALPEDIAMTRDVPTIRSPTLPNGRPTRPIKSNSVSLNKGRRESLSKTQRQESNKKSATKHRGRLFKMIDDAWEMIPDDEKRGLGEKRTLKRLERLEIAIGYFSKLRRIHSQIIALLE